MRGLSKALGLGVVAALFIGAAPLHAQAGIVRGQVSDAAGQPLADVLMSLVGTNVTVRTDLDGRYELRNLTPGTATIRAAVIGYAARTLTVDVGAVAAELNFQLEMAAISLDAMVVTATGEQRAVEVPNVVTTINAAQAATEVAPPTMSSLIQGRAPGVQIINSGGTAGTGTKIRIRGSSSMSLTNEPLLVVDGIRVDNRSDDLNPYIGVGGQTISRINDLNPDEIESIEVVKGPSAAALYGTEAANGVIVVKTKRGRVGAPVWNVYGEFGLKSDITDWPNNYSGLDAAGDWCPIFVAADGGCDIASIEYANPLESKTTTPITTAPRYQFGANVAGGTTDVQYFLSAEYERENGIYALPQHSQDSILAVRPEGYEIPDFVLNPNRVTRMSLRGNLNAQLSEALNLLVSTGYVDGKIRLPQNDNNVMGMLPSGLFGSSDSTDGVGAWGFFRPEEVFWVETDQRVQRFTQSVTAMFNPTRWLDFRGIAGVDYSTIADVQFQPIGNGPDFSNYKDDGARNSGKASTWQQTLDFGGTARFRLTDRISSRTSAGIQYFRNYRELVNTYGEKLPPGAGSNASATDQFIGEAFTETRTLGTYVEQQFGLDDRLYVTAGLRGDDNSAFGADFDYTVYPKLGASYLLLSHSGGLLDDVRLRAAWGASGVAPGTNDAVLFYTGVPFANKGTEETGVVIQNAGNTDLKPERSTEWEGGMEIGLFGGRLAVDATFYYRTTSDALVNRELAPSLGLTQNRYENLAQTRNYGFEGGINGTVLRNSLLTWDFSLTGSTNTNEVVELGEGIEPIIFNDVQAHKKGYPLGAYHERTFSYEDVNGDGLIGIDEVTIGDSTEFLGYSRPRYEVSFFNAFNVGSWLRISGLFDYRGGHKLWNYTEQFRCMFAICQPLNDPEASLYDQARATAGSLTETQSAAGYIEPAWFIKLRELSFTFYAPANIARMLGSSRASLTITGRNLFKITDYTGLDPEIQETSGNFSSDEFLGQPPVRYWTARIQLTF